MQRMTPRDQYQRRTPMNNNPQMMDYPPEEYQRNSPNNMQRMTPRDQYQRRTPMNNNYDPRMEYPPEEYQRNTPNNMQRMTPQQEYQRGNPNIDQREQYEQYEYQNNRQNQIRMTPKQQYQYENGNPEYDPRLNYRRTPSYNDQRMTPQQRGPNGTPYNQNSYNEILHIKIDNHPIIIIQ